MRSKARRDRLCPRVWPLGKETLAQELLDAVLLGLRQDIADRLMCRRSYEASLGQGGSARGNARQRMSACGHVQSRGPLERRTALFSGRDDEGFAHRSYEVIRGHQTYRIVLWTKLVIVGPFRCPYLGEGCG